MWIELNIMWNNTGPNFIYFSTSSCISLGQIELIKYLQLSFTLASSNSECTIQNDTIDNKIEVQLLQNFCKTFLLGVETKGELHKYAFLFIITALLMWINMPIYGLKKNSKF